MPTNKELEAELRALAASHRALLAICRRLTAHAEVAAVAARRPEAVPRADLDEAIDGLGRLHTELAALELDA